MTSPSMRLWRRLSSVRGNDRGATLMYALIFTTVLAVILASILALADTNLRSTQAVRKQAALAAAADGAAKVAINKLRLGTFSGATGSDCWGGTPMTVPYTDPDGVSHTLNVQCTADPDTSIGQVSVAIPPVALAALDAVKTNVGIDINVQGSGTIYVQGNVATPAEIDIANKGKLKVTDGTVNALGLCPGPKTGSKGTIVGADGSTQISCGTTIPTIPAYTALVSDPTALPAQTPPSCSSVMTFSPGKYTSLSQLTTAMNCSNARYDFRPGVYYFAFGGEWKVWQNTLIAGRPTPLTATETLQTSGNCADPMRAPVAGSGVQFIFASGSFLTVTQSATVELCGRTSLTQPPIVIYGLGAGNVFGTDNQASNINLRVHGMIYAKTGVVNLQSRKDGGEFFTGGIIAKSLTMFGPASSNPTTPMVSVPFSTQTFESRLVAVIEVSLDGKSLLKSKVGFTDPTGTPQAGNRGVTVYSWSVQR